MEEQLGLYIVMQTDGIDENTQSHWDHVTETHFTNDSDFMEETRILAFSRGFTSDFRNKLF
jgi:hypothetical protein